MKQLDHELECRSVMVIGVDFSEGSQQAVSVALNLARITRSPDLHLIHVLKHAPLTGLGDWSGSINEYEKAVEEARHELDILCAAAIEKFPLRAFAHVRTGEAHREIVQLASDIEADLVVIGTHLAQRREQAVARLGGGEGAALGTVSGADRQTQRATARQRSRAALSALPRASHRESRSATVVRAAREYGQELFPAQPTSAFRRGDVGGRAVLRFGARSSMIPTSTTPASPVPAPPNRRRRGYILLVEDDTGVREGLSEIFAAEGTRSSAATVGGDEPAFVGRRAAADDRARLHRTAHGWLGLSRRAEEGRPPAAIPSACRLQRLVDQRRPLDDVDELEKTVPRRRHAALIEALAHSGMGRLERAGVEKPAV